MMTPEHLQLLSDRALDQAADAERRADAPAEDRALARAARFEQRRRRCEVPVKDRFATDEQ